MKTPGLVALAGLCAIGVGLSAAVGIGGSHASIHVSAAAGQNGALTPHVDTPSQSAAPMLAPSSPPSAAAVVGRPPLGGLTVNPPGVPVNTEPIRPLGQVRAMADGHPVVYLTFDDGPSLTHTAPILQVLQRHHAHATFFVEGRFAHRYPQLVLAELAAGDSVGSHTWTHPHLPRLSEAEIRYQLVSTQHFLRSLGSSAQCIRPPFGQTSPVVHRVEAQLGVREYLWTTETKDWTHASAQRDLRRAAMGLHPGAIIVFHDGRGSGSKETVAAVDRFLSMLDQRGYVALPLPC